MNENPVRRPIVPPIAENISTAYDNNFSEVLKNKSLWICSHELYSLLILVV